MSYIIYIYISIHILQVALGSCKFFFCGGMVRCVLFSNGMLESDPLVFPNWYTGTPK